MKLSLFDIDMAAGWRGRFGLSRKHWQAPGVSLSSAHVVTIEVAGGFHMSAFRLRYDRVCLNQLGSGRGAAESRLMSSYDSEG